MSDPPQWDVDGCDWPLREHSRFVDSASLRWHVQILGEGPPLLLLHGTGAATHSWRGLAPLLARRFTVIMPDLPGHGFTSGRPAGGAGLPAVTAAVASLMTTLNVAPVGVVGHSAGAAVALRLALDGRIAPEAVIGLGAALLPFPGIAGQIFPTMAKLLFVNPFAPHLFAHFARAPGETARFLARSTGSRINAAGAECYRRLFGRAGHCGGALAMMAAWDLAPLARDLPGLRPPLLLLHGADDAAIPVAAARKGAALVPGARLELLPGLGHLAHEERPDLVVPLIDEMLP